MGLRGQASILDRQNIELALMWIDGRRNPERDRVLFLLSVKAGLRAKEISGLTWDLVLNPNGEVDSHIRIVDSVAKGTTGGRRIPLNKDLRKALVLLKDKRWNVSRDEVVIRSERSSISNPNRNMNPRVIVQWFKRLYTQLNLSGCSSHSGRRTFGTNAAKKIVEAGGTLRDVQQLLGHKDLKTTQRYIEGDENAKLKVVDLI